MAITYEDLCKQKCEWCAKGSMASVHNGTVHKVYPLTSSGGFQDAAVKGPFSEYFPCTAPTIEVAYESLRSQLAERDETIHQLEIANLPLYSDRVKGLESERDSLRSELETANKRIRAPDWKGCPMKTEDVVRARVDLKAECDSLRAQLESAGLEAMRAGEEMSRMPVEGLEAEADRGRGMKLPEDQTLAPRAAPDWERMYLELVDALCSPSWAGRDRHESVIGLARRLHNSQTRLQAMAAECTRVTGHSGPCNGFPQAGCRNSESATAPETKERT
jgi:hypothetical protein